MNAIELGRAFDISDRRCLSHADAVEAAKLLQAAGADAIQVRNHWLGYHVGGFFPDYLFYPEPPIPVERFPAEYNWQGHGAAANLNLAAAMRAALDIPVVLVGKMDADLGEDALREGKADFIAMTRRLQADPELPRKLAAGRSGDIAPCTACGTCLDQSISMARRCRINVQMGSTDYELHWAETPRTVVVVGGGPAGMEAARVAAERGHRVTLFEKSSRLGGLMPLAALVKGHEPENLPDMIGYYERQLARLGVETRLGTAADVERVAGLAPDVVIVATGGTLTAPEVPRTGGPRVLTAPTLHRLVKPLLRVASPRDLDRLTTYYLPVGTRVVVIGGGFQGCEIAEFLTKRGRSVTILEQSDFVGTGVLDFRLGLLMDWFAKKRVEVVTEAGDIAITPQGVAFSLPDGNRHVVEADAVIPTAPVAPDTRLFDRLQATAAEVYAVGDCREPGMIVDAVASAYGVATNI